MIYNLFELWSIYGLRAKSKVHFFLERFVPKVDTVFNVLLNSGMLYFFNVLLAVFVQMGAKFTKFL